MDEQTLVAGLTRPQLHELFYGMALARAAEERLETQARQGLVRGNLYRSLGQEACSVGVAYPLRRRGDGIGDVLAPTVRDAGAVFLMGATPLEYFRQFLSRATSPSRGRESGLGFTDLRRGLLGPIGSVGAMLEVMAGVTLAFRMKGEDRVGVVLCGDGSTSTGAWHEGLNLAAARRCPMVVAVIANAWAFSTPTSKQTRIGSFTERAPGYGVHAESADGNDVIAVLEATRRAVERARAGEGVTLLELRTYRRVGHAQHDALEYVPAAELEEWERKDPILQFLARMLAEDWSTGGELAALVHRAELEVKDAADLAVTEGEPEGVTALEAVYSDVELRAPWTRLALPDPRRS
jgi:pyruvate dehydrogenase E1 component alpha subunit/2-oxoisovalerate dehydrogenase E1 component alpha subunit